MVKATIGLTFYGGVNELGGNKILLKKALREMGGKRLFPVHTESADLFAGFVRDLSSEVTLVEKNREYTL